MTKKIKAIGGSDGIALEKAHLLIQPEIKVVKKIITDTKHEIEKYTSALAKSVDQLKQILQIVEKKLGEEKAVIFEAHIDIINDQEMVDAIKQQITSESVNAEFATDTVFAQYIEIFANAENSYLKERVADLKDLRKRLLANILNIKLQDITLINQPCILVADDLTPSETSLLDKQFVKGFVTKIGAKTSHSAIMARTMEIPCVLSLADDINLIKQGDVIAINGTKGIVELGEIDKKQWQKDIDQYLSRKEILKQYKNKQTITLDNHKVMLETNIGNADDALLSKEYGSEGVGLFRTEFLYMNSTSNWPSEETQYENYLKTLTYLKGQVVVIRTLDIGGDKKLPYYTFPREMNPFLGYRAIRLCLDQRDIFITQLRAILRASVAGELAIMFPMVATVEEFVTAKQITLDTAAKLRSEGHKVADNIKIGMMIEIPSSAIIADVFAKYADFFSIGTNDLIQYTMACDRMSKQVSYLYQPNNPAILKLVNKTIQASHDKKKWTAMCGEMASNVLSIPILLGLGLDYFSMSASSILQTRYLINNLKYSECQKLAQEALALDTATQVDALVTDFLNKRKLL